MGGCYSKKAGHIGEAYSYPVRGGSPARLRKRSGMNRTAPYSRQSGSSRPTPSAGPPAHSFGFRRRPGVGGGGGGGGGGPRRAAAAAAVVTPASTSSESVASVGSDANGNQKVMKRTLPRPLVARVKPRTSTGGGGRQGNAAVQGKHGQAARELHQGQQAKLAQTGRPDTAGSLQVTNVGRSTPRGASSAPPASSRTEPAGKVVSPRRVTLMDDSGMGTMQGSLSSTTSTLSGAETMSPEEPQTLDMLQTVPHVRTKLQQRGKHRDSERHVSEVEEARDKYGEIRDLQVGIQTGDATIALSVNIHKGANPALRRPQVTVMDGGGRARVTQIQRPGFGATQPAGLTRPAGIGGSTGANIGGSTGAAVGGSTGAHKDGGGGTPKDGASVNSSYSGGTGPRTSPVTGPPSLATPKLNAPRPPGLEQTVRSRVTRWEERVDQVRRQTIATPPIRGDRATAATPMRGERPLSGGAPNLAGLRREMRQLTRDVATSPLRRPPLRDTGTCTDAHVGHVAGRRGLAANASLHSDQDSPRADHSGAPPVDPLSPLTSSDSPEARTGNEDFIDDEIGDQPAFGAYGAESLSPGGFLEDVLSAGLSEPTSPPLPPLQITEALRDDYVRPFRLTPRPLTSITTLETPLRRWAAEPSTSASDRGRQMAGEAAAAAESSASERRQQMEDRAERLAKRLGVSAAPLGTTYQRLGLPEPAGEVDSCLAGDATPLVKSSSDVQAAASPFTAGTPSGASADAPSDKLTAITRPPTVEQSPAVVSTSTPTSTSTSTSTSSSGAPIPPPKPAILSTPPVAASSPSPATSPPSSVAPSALAASTGPELQTSSVQRPSEDLKEEEDVLSDLESRDEVFPGCRPRRCSWRRVSELRELTSPSESLNSDDLMADFDKDSDDAMDEEDSLTGQGSRLQRLRLRAASATDSSRPSPEPSCRLLRPPRQSSTNQEAAEWLLIDRDTYMYMAQDFTHTKTMLHRLRRLLLDAETTNPFENSIQAGRRGTSVSSESQLSSLDGRRSGDGGADLAAENADLKRQVSALQQQVTDQARTIRLLQQQMGSCAAPPPDVSSVATQASQALAEEPNVISVAPERG